MIAYIQLLIFNVLQNAIVDLCQDRDNQRYDFKNTQYQLIASTAC